VHHCETAALGQWLTGQLGFDPSRGIATLDWLATPAQRLAEITGGAVFHDGLGELGTARAGLAWYPRDVWLYILACQWGRIGQEEAFAGRCAEVGDEVGAAVVAARLVRDMMRLGLLMPPRLPALQQMARRRFRPAAERAHPHALADRRALGEPWSGPRAASICRA